MNKKLYKSNQDKMLCGVLGGLGEYLGVDSTIIRILFTVISVFSAGFPGLLIYLICALVIPEKPFDVEQ